MIIVETYLKESQHERAERLAVMGWGALRGHSKYIAAELRQVLSCKGQLQGDQLVQDHARGPGIRFGVVRVAHTLLGRHVERRAALGVR